MARAWPCLAVALALELLARSNVLSQAYSLSQHRALRARVYVEILVVRLVFAYEEVPKTTFQHLACVPFYAGTESSSHSDGSESDAENHKVNLYTGQRCDKRDCFGFPRAVLLAATFQRGVGGTLASFRTGLDLRAYSRY